MKRFYRTTALALVTSASVGAAAHAGSLTDAVVEPTVTAPAPATFAPTEDWTGFYGGLQIGYADVSGPGALDGDNGTYGGHIGYDRDLGTYVIGVELDYDKTDIDLGGGAADVDSIARAKFRFGADMGKTLIYSTLGVAQADTSFGNETGPFGGLGIARRVSENYTIGAELLAHDFHDAGGVSTNDLDATTMTIRGSLRF